jgi:hypothetical protein
LNWKRAVANSVRTQTLKIHAAAEKCAEKLILFCRRYVRDWKGARKGTPRILCWAFTRTGGQNHQKLVVKTIKSVVETIKNKVRTAQNAVLHSPKK